MANNFKFGDRSLKCLENVDVRLQLVAKLALQKSAVDFGISSGFRTAEEQKILFDHGYSKCDGIIKKSKHQSGRAIDVYAYVNGKLSYDVLLMDRINYAFREAAFSLGTPITWGGEWRSFPDLPHFELKLF